MRKRYRAGLVATCVGGALLMVAAGPAAPDPSGGFLPAGYVNLIDVLLPAPIAQEPRGVADREVYKLTRALKGTTRWQMAVGDSSTDTATMMRGFACAARVNMTPVNAPKTAALLERASRDSLSAANGVRVFYKKRRPFLADPGETCEAQTDSLSVSYDYPAPAATRGWTWALILSELVDDRAAPILARGRAFGDSRRICNVHWLSDTEEGRLIAPAVLARLHSDPAFAADLEAARAEVATARKTLPTRDCAAEAAALAL